MVAAQAAALSFIEHQKPNTQIGIVAFAGFAALVQPPTTDAEVLKTAIETLYTARRTAIGSGIVKSIDAIAEINPNVAPSGFDPATGLEPTPVPEGAYVPDIIVVLTDGASNTGIHPLDAAQQAVDRGIRVYTIGYGTEFPDNSWMDCSIQLQGDDPFGRGFDFGGGGGFGGGMGGGFRRGIDEDTLKQVAALTGGKYYAATSASELEKVLISLPTYLITKLEFMEISVGFAAAAALLMAMAILFSLLWSPLP
jgi:Ca-activated chloride channel family protein